MDPADLAESARARGVNLAILRSSDPRTPELKHALQELGIPILSAGERARQIETTRAFMLSFAGDHGIPTLPADVFTYYPQLEDVLTRSPGRYRLRKSIPTADLDTLDTDDLQTQLSFARRVLETDSLLLEQTHDLPAISIIAITDGKTARVFPACERHDRRTRSRPVGTPNSAGAVAPVPWVDPELQARIKTDIVDRTVQALESSGFSHRGVIAFGVRISAAGPLLESVRLGLSEPEASVLMPLLDIDLGVLLESVLEQKLIRVPFGMRNASSMAVVLSNDTADPLPIPQHHIATPGSEGLDAHVFLGRQELEYRGPSVPPGERITAVGLGHDALRARNRAMRLAGDLSAEGLSFSRDVGLDLFR